MANWCMNRHAFFTDQENESELIRFHEKLSTIMKTPSEVPNGFEPGWLGKVAIAHEIDWKEISCKGEISILDEYEPGSNCFTLESESAWSPTNELWEAVIAKYEGVAFVYISEESGMGIYTNTDVDARFFFDRYLLEILGDAPIPEDWYVGQDKPGYLEIREYFESLDAFTKYCADFTGQKFSTYEEWQNYFSSIFDEESGVIAGVHEFTTE